MSCSRRESRVGRISAVAPTSPSSAVSICHTTSITSDPENAWIARRQSAITAALARGRAERFVPDERDTRNEPRFSGESERIGEGNWDEASPFGRHVGYL